MFDKKTFDQAKLDLFNKFNFIELLEYNGCNKICKCKDLQFGEFEGIYKTILSGRKVHKKRNNLNKLNSFEHAKEKVEKLQPNLKLITFNGTLEIAKFLDCEFGEFEGIYKNVIYGNKSHSNRNSSKSKIRSLNQVNEKIKSKYSYLTVLEYNGLKVESKFLDCEFGEFKGYYNRVWNGDKKHPKRGKLNKGLNKKTFDQAKNEIELKHNHLQLLKYNGTDKICDFLDKEFGEFKGVYKRVYYGSKSHPKRGEINRSESSKIPFDVAKKNINDKFPHLQLLSYNGYRDDKNSIFIDKDFGEFTAAYKDILRGTKHPKRKQFELYKKNFKKHKNKIEKKFNYLELLEYNGEYEISKFLDKEFGEFYGNFFTVYKGRKCHPDRVKKYRVLKRIKTNLEKYGCEHACQNDIVIEKKNKH